MVAEDNSPNAAKPIADVEQPGKSAASATSKPVIVTNRPIIKDPMVVEEQLNDDGPPKESKENLPVKGSSTTKIKPLDSSPKPEVQPAGASADPKAGGTTDTEPAVPEKPDSPEQPVPPIDKTTDDTQKNDKKPTTPAEDEAAETARQAEHDANLQKIADAKTYYLPINAVEKRRTKRVVVLGVAFSVLLALVWLDVALDAGLVQIHGISPLTHFFSI